MLRPVGYCCFGHRPGDATAGAGIRISDDIRALSKKVWARPSKPIFWSRRKASTMADSLNGLQPLKIFRQFLISMAEQSTGMRDPARGRNSRLSRPRAEHPAMTGNIHYATELECAVQVGLRVAARKMLRYHPRFKRRVEQRHYAIATWHTVRRGRMVCTAHQCGHDEQHDEEEAAPLPAKAVGKHPDERSEHSRRGVRH